ncbi:oligopeptide/dipeptide ABC transporter ATP-binding protein [Varunaivibrio sulfuroxidans]|uniref:Peptide/nickel transport system ATP-binding protein n=1 Tax=Varunaivibrio sulfuroxidans TaxID=1773489 RepID=A0A4R3JC11_9PROT|nr:oligopeptide/dipeptide ABC transporter ATP-binding protein [Varunaivibrio sulfuroxidans]TCS62180.1 peptide/nickel transport system ATP-binding protein [Varunaivibrio sulfuroxidans]WES30607.1 ATP-binding cassette domain-containing protein [Varunaivibrio sulfuroxidans]
MTFSDDPTARPPTPDEADAPDVALSLREIEVCFPLGQDWRGRPKGYVHAVNGVTVDVLRGETLGIVGESGCGKSTLAQALVGLVPLSGGTLKGPATHADARRMQMIFQDPQSSLDPRMRVWRIITEPLSAQRRMSKDELRERAGQLAQSVGLRPEHLDRFAHEFSGGQRQRIAIARALAPDPEVIILDEPTSALDVSVQAQILNLLLQVQRERGLTYVFISHDVSVIHHVAKRVAVMYLGQIVELGSSEAVLAAPRHPYTRALLDAVPRMMRPLESDAPIDASELPSNRILPSGCFFLGRCPFATKGCHEAQTLRPDEGTGEVLVRCHRAQDLPPLVFPPADLPGDAPAHNSTQKLAQD